MFNDVCFGRYILGDSIIHRLNPIFKVLSVIVMIISIFFVDSYDDILMLFFYLILTIMYSDIGILVYYRNVYGIRMFLLFILVIDIIFFEGISKIVFDLFKLIFIVIYASILTYTTKMMDIVYAISWLGKPISKVIPTLDISMIVVLTIRYIPSLIGEVSRMIRAQKMRGLDIESKGIIERLAIISKMLIPMFVLSIKRALDSADIMDLRLYNYGKSRSSYRVFKWGYIDTLLFVLNILILIVVIIY